MVAIVIIDIVSVVMVAIVIIDIVSVVIMVNFNLYLNPVNQNYPNVKARIAIKH